MTRDDGARGSHTKLLKEHPRRKRPKFAVNLWTIEALRRPSPKKQSKKSKKWYRSRSKKNKKLKHRRYSSSPSPWSSSNDDSDEIKYRNIGGKESKDYRFRVVSDEDQYKYILLPDMV